MMNFGNCYTKFVFGLEQINEAAAYSTKDFIMSMERRYKDEIATNVEYILKPENECKVLMLAGPSGSGKTTTANMIKSELERRGKKAILISLDDFYLGEGRAPQTEDGSHDYEAAEALDIPQIKGCLLGLMEKGECELPRFNFKEKRPFKEKRHVELREGEIAIVEGIHGLNPMFTSNIPKNGLLKMYVSVKQGIKDYNGAVLSRRDVRLTRRIVRDHLHRGTSAEQTFAMWDNVCRGEVLYIHPFKRTSDCTINSIHIYESCVLSVSAIPLLREIKQDSPYYYPSRRLLSALERFYPIDPVEVPKDSLIREFIGDGIYE